MLSFHITHMLSNNAAFYFQAAVQPINITPAKGERFTDAKAKADAHQSNGPEWLSQMLNELLELFNRQIARLSCPFARAFDRD